MSVRASVRMSRHWCVCPYLDGVELVDARPEVVRVSSERDLQQRQEAVHPGQQTLRTEETNGHVTATHAPSYKRLCVFKTWLWFLRVGVSVPGGNAVEHDDSVGQVGRHDEVVLYHERRLLCMEDVPAGENTAESDRQQEEEERKRSRSR